jgi:hypothetical protein
LHDLLPPYHNGAWVADSYYGNLVGADYSDTSVVTTPVPTFVQNRNNTSDGKWDQDVNPDTVEVPVGRVDFWNL